MLFKDKDILSIYSKISELFSALNVVFKSPMSFVNL